MTRRPRIDDVAPLMGRDLQLTWTLRGGFYEDADLTDVPGRGGRRDLEVADSIENITQAIVNRLKTRRGELAPLGHPEYGSRHHELIGEPNVARTRNLVKLYILQALRQEPRIEKVVSSTVRAEHDPPRDTVRVELSVRLIGVATPVDLVIPFSLEAAP
ncbi:MAG TPA: GPW/gp25 family protein [Kofleriaceae bacterium]|nr:GPW/gp25 family protein [Kofleriaceae bacterium]